MIRTTLIRHRVSTLRNVS